MTFTWMILELADGMSERMKIREELSEVSSDDQNIMSASAAEGDPSNGNCAHGACQSNHSSHHSGSHHHGASASASAG